MAPLSLKIILDEGAVTRTIKFDTVMKVEEAHRIVRDKILTVAPDKAYGFFLTSADDECSGVWLEGDRKLEYYMLRDGDSLYYLPKLRNLRVRMLDGSVKTMQVDESKKVGELMELICLKIRIANYEEYGLCLEDQNTEEDAKTNTGTLTLRRKTAQREKDAQLQQLSKKLKTDDNVEWLNQHKTLKELRVDPKTTLLFKRRLFYSDRNVDSRDPVQLNLLYVQTRDAILDGRQVVTEDKAAEFAGIQCQIQYGNYQEDKHKPGFIENLKEFLPTQYAGSWGVEKKIIKEHRKHEGLSQVEAKHLYTKTARELPTYGVTFFLVKERQKNKKKLVPRLLGINSESILRLDEETKEILQTWSLTKVKTFRAASESFTLNFGDYSEKEYAVKTNEATRIKDILQGYIDIIGKKLAAARVVKGGEGEVIYEDNVNPGRGTIIQSYTAAPATHAEEHIFGPSQVVAVEQGQNFSQGAQIVTYKDLVVAGRGSAIKITEKCSGPNQFGKQLNLLNSESVKAVTLLMDPTKENIQELRNITQNMENALPDIIIGVKEMAAKMSDQEARKVLDDLDELCGYINSLVTASKHGDFDDPDKLMSAKDAASRIADLSTQIYFSLDSKTRRRSKLLLQSRNSFIADEKTEASLRRASLLAAADTTRGAVDNAHVYIQEEYMGPEPGAEEISGLECELASRLGKLNAAVAQLLIANADPKNVDFEMAVNSMKTIQDQLPQLVQESKALSSGKDGPSGAQLRDAIRELIERTRNICALTGTADSNKMQDAGNNFADASSKLLFIFKKPRLPGRDDSEETESDEIIGAAKDVVHKTSRVLVKVDELSRVAAGDPQCAEVDLTAAGCADAAQRLLACARLTAPSIQEPHCQSALAAASEDLSSSAQKLANAWKVLVEKPGHHVFGAHLNERLLELAKALDNLKNSCTKVNRSCEDLSEDLNSDKKRLKFIATLASAKKALDDARNDLEDTNTLDPGTSPNMNVADAKRRLAQKLAQLNAALAALVQATSDRQNPDLTMADLSSDTISTLTPDILQDVKSLNGNIDDSKWCEIAEELKKMLEAAKDICENTEDTNAKDINETASKFMKSSGKLMFVFNPRSSARKENQVLELSRAAGEQTSVMLSKVYHLMESVSGEEGQALDVVGAKVVDAAQNLLTCAEITAPCIDDARCQAALIAAVDHHALAANKLETLWNPLLQGPECHQLQQDLQSDMQGVLSKLEELRDVIQSDSSSDASPVHADSAEDSERRRKFTETLSSAVGAIEKARQQLADTNPQGLADSPNINVAETKRRLAQKLAQLNAALAALVQATSDRQDPNIKDAESSIAKIRTFASDIINDVKSLNGNLEDSDWCIIKGDLSDMLEAAKDICDDTQHNSAKDINETASKYLKSSGRLMYVFNPRSDVLKGNQVLELSRAAGEQTSTLLSKVYQLVESADSEEGQALDAAGARVVDAAQNLLTCAGLTASSIGDNKCQVALISAVDNQSQAAGDLERLWTPLVQHLEHAHLKDNLQSDLKTLESTLDKLRELFGTDNGTPQLKEDDDIWSDDILDRVKNNLLKSETILNDRIHTNLFKENTGQETIVDAVNSTSKKNLLSQNLAKLNNAIAQLVQAMSDRANPDHKTARLAVANISHLTPEIVQEIIELEQQLDGDAKEVLEDAKSLCEASRHVCASAGNSDSNGLNEAASRYAVLSKKLRFTISPRHNTHEFNMILDATKSVCERASLMLSRVSRLAESVPPQHSRELDVSGTAVADAAQSLLMSAQVTGASIDDNDCRATLCLSADKLLSLSQGLRSIWKPLVQNEKLHQLGEQMHRDQDLLQIGLNKLKTICEEQSDDGESWKNAHDLSDANEKLARDHILPEELVIEATPLKKMTLKILSAAQAKSESISVPPEKRNAFANFTKKLEGALRSLDLANAKCRNRPLDIMRRQEMEAAILNLQQMCLFSKNLDGEESYIVDLGNYINDVTSTTEDLLKLTNDVRPSTNHVTDVKVEAQEIIKDAITLLNDSNVGEIEITEDIMKYDHFGKNCESRVEAMKEALNNMPEGEAKVLLQQKVDLLEENTDLMRFAAQCNLASATSVSFDDTLENLSLIETHIDSIIKSSQGNCVPQTEDDSDSIACAHEELMLSLANTKQTPKAFAKYVLRVRGLQQPGEENRRVKDHLKEIAELLKTQVAVKARKVATWQDLDDEECTAINEKIIQELADFQKDLNNHIGNNSHKSNNLLTINEFKNLLQPNKLRISADNGELQDKFLKLVQKLSSAAGSLVRSSSRPESVGDCVAAMADTASRLAAVAKSIKTESPVAEKRIEEAADALCVVTWRLSTAAQSLSHVSNGSDGRRSLHERCQRLNDSINRLVRTVFPVAKLQQECAELVQNLQMQEAFLQASIPSCALSYADCLDALQSQHEVIDKLRSEEPLTRAKCTESLKYINSAICNATEYATQSSYLLSLSDKDRTVVENGLVDVIGLKKLTQTLQDGCVDLMCCGDNERMKDLISGIQKNTQQLEKTIDENGSKLREDLKTELDGHVEEVKSAVEDINKYGTGVAEQDKNVSKIVNLLSAVDGVNSVLNKIEEPKPDDYHKTQETCRDIIDNSRNLIKSVSSFAKKTAASEDDTLTWVMFGGADVVKTFQSLVDSIRRKGVEMKLIEPAEVPEEEEALAKSYLQIQIDLANRWLKNPVAKADVKEMGVRGVQHVIDIAEKVSEDLREADRDEMKHVVSETNQLLNECSHKYNSEKTSLLMERLKELKSMLERGVVTRVVEDFLEDEYDVGVDGIVKKEQDKEKRTFILEKRIAELLAQLGRVTGTARLVADTGSGRSRRRLLDTTHQFELLAPDLVKAAQRRMSSPDDEEAIAKYKALFEEYAKSLASVRALCDGAVDPVDLVQAAGETMHCLKEESSRCDSPQRLTYTSKVILRLGNRVIDASMNSPHVQKDQDMQTTLRNIKETIAKNQLQSPSADWGAVTAEIIKRTSQVEAILGGETIFEKEPEPDQPIYAAALDLHAAVKDWSARDNEIVAVAKRMAVLMAKLANYMNMDYKRELIDTSKAIVSSSAEVVTIARKLALECTDMRIRTNLLQVCDRIPTISGQLKMLTTVKGFSFGQQDSAEDKEAMNTLVCNAQNLMTSVQEVVKAAASASVKIMSQRGHRMKWVRRKRY